MYCPKQDCPHAKRTGQPAEFQPGVIECSDCGSALVEAEPVWPDEVPDESTDEQMEWAAFVPVLTLQGAATVSVAKSLLQSAGIRFFIKNEQVQDLFGVGQLGSGFNAITGAPVVLVEPERAEEVAELLASLEAEELVGSVIDYDPHRQVAVVEVAADVAVGETLSFHGDSADFSQAIESMEVDHQPLEAASAGTEVAITVGQRVHPGTQVYRGSPSTVQPSLEGAPSSAHPTDDPEAEHRRETEERPIHTWPIAPWPSPVHEPVTSEELLVFLHENERADGYLLKWEPTLRGEEWRAGFNWAAFAFGPYWCFWRRQYLLGAIVLALTVIEAPILVVALPLSVLGVMDPDFLFTGSNAVVTSLFGFACLRVPLGAVANRLYLGDALETIRRARRTSGHSALRQIHSEGGTSGRALAATIVLSLLLRTLV